MRMKRGGHVRRREGERRERKRKSMKKLLSMKLLTLKYIFGQKKKKKKKEVYVQNVFIIITRLLYWCCTAASFPSPARRVVHFLYPPNLYVIDLFTLLLLFKSSVMDVTTSPVSFLFISVISPPRMSTSSWPKLGP